MGGRGASKIQWKFANNNLRLHDIDAVHMRKLAKIEHNSYEREAYEQALGAKMLRPDDILTVAFDPINATNNGQVVTYPRQTIIVDLDTPWGSDKEVRTVAGWCVHHLLTSSVVLQATLQCGAS